MAMPDSNTGNGLICLGVGLLITLGWPIPRSTNWNFFWSLWAFSLFVAAAYLIGYWDPLSNLALGGIGGGLAFLLRDWRHWKRYRSLVKYYAPQRYHYYGELDRRLFNWYYRWKK